MDMSYEQLVTMSDAYAKKDAENMLLLMTATQGDQKSWLAQRNLLLKRLG